MNERFTPEEEALLTPFNAAAYDLLRVTSKAIQPCWLCMSDKARTEAREALLFILQSHLGPPGMSMELAESLVVPLIPEAAMEQWRAAELGRKRGRARHDPNAYFMQND